MATLSSRYNNSGSIAEKGFGNVIRRRRKKAKGI